VRKSYGNQLSGGERRRTEIARAVAINPSFILLDEPFRGLDPATKENAALLIREITHRVILVITHDESDVALLNGKTLSFPDLQNGIC
jgi:lipopolysaccharide export system ATP-binding protein